MATLLVKKGDTKVLPGNGNNKFVGGLGWDAAEGSNDKVDLDLWVLRFSAGNPSPFVVAWANSDCMRPDLGQNSEGQPWMATPELDVVHQGDDRTGAESSTGYDEVVTIDPSKAPANVERYVILVSYYEDPDTGSGMTLGMATGIVCGFRDEVSGHELKAPVEDDHGFDVTAHVVTISKTADGKWQMENVDKGYSENAISVVVNEFGYAG